jgi:hypothetical protein
MAYPGRRRTRLFKITKGRFILGLALLMLAGCSRQELEQMLLRLMEHRDRIESTPPPAQDAAVLDLSKLPSPVLQIERGKLTFDHKPLPYPGLASEWEKVLGVARQPYRDIKPDPYTHETRHNWCFLLWDALGLTAVGSWTTAEGQALDTCRIEQLSVLLDDKPGYYRPAPVPQPRAGLAGSLLVDGIRVQPGMTWQATYGAFWNAGTKCARGSSTERYFGCSRQDDCFTYVVEAARHENGTARLVVGFAVEWLTYTEPRCALSDAAVPLPDANHP